MTEPTWSLVFMEVIKYTLPAIIVFLTIYFLFKEFFKGQRELAILKDRSEHRDKMAAIKLQAYERLMLYCDRMDVVNMAMRLNNKDMNAKDLMQAMLISIQKEYEHNATQQMYVSETLWKVISQAKSSTIKLIASAFESVNDQDSAQVLLRAISEKMDSVQLNPADQAKMALRSETASVLNLQ